MTGATRRLVVVTPWYPTTGAPFWGTFVREHALALERHVQELVVLHVQSGAPGSEPEVLQENRDGLDVRRITIPVEATSREDVARAHADALRSHAAAELARADIVHAHVGMPSAWATAAALPDGTPFFVTEHASYLPTLLRGSGTKAMYGDMLGRCETYWIVSPVLRDQVRAAFPDRAERVQTLPNPLRVDRLPLPPPRRTALRRWLFVGNLIEAKGLRRLLRAFAACDPERRGLSLSLVGSGPLHDDLEQQVHELGLRGRVALRPAIDPDQIGAVYAEHDLLVHLSHSETFGMTVLEAAACGLAVLVTRCGGPEHNLDDVAALGGVRFVPPGEDTGSVVEAFFDLERGLPDVEPRARQLLAARFGGDAVARRVLAGYGWAPREPAAGRGPRVLAVDLGGTQPQAAASLRSLAEGGPSVVLVTARPGHAEVTGAAMRVVDLQPLDRSLPRPRGLDAATARGPATALRVARRLVTRLPGTGPVDRVGAVVAIDAAREHHTQWLRNFRRTSYRNLYERAWPRLLVGPALRGPLAPLRSESFDVVYAATPSDHRLAREIVGPSGVRPRALERDRMLRDLAVVMAEQPAAAAGERK